MSAAERVIVVGGGVAGLVAARELALAGREVLLLERTDRLGGQLRSHSVAGIDLDAGADSFAPRGELLRLVGALGLADDVEGARGSGGWLHRADGTSVPLPALQLLGIPGVPLARDVAAAIGMGAALRAQLDTLLPGLVAAKATTLEELVRARMGRGVLERLVAPVVRAAFSATPGELGVEETVPGLARRMLSAGNLAGAVRVQVGEPGTGGRGSTLRGGLFRLADAFVAELSRFGVEVRTGIEVTAADPAGVTTAAGERIRGEVLLAAPLEAPRSPVTCVTLALEAEELADAPRGWGVAVAVAAPEVAAAGLEHLSVTWPWLAEASPVQFVRLRYEEGAEATAARAHRDAELLLGRRLPQPVDVATVRWERPQRRNRVEHAIDGMRRVGEAESGAGLAAVVSYARSVAGAIPSNGDRIEG